MGSPYHLAEEEAGDYCHSAIAKAMSTVFSRSAICSAMRMAMSMVFSLLAICSVIYWATAKVFLS